VGEEKAGGEIRGGGRGTGMRGEKGERWLGANCGGGGAGGGSEVGECGEERGVGERGGWAVGSGGV